VVPGPGPFAPRWGYDNQVYGWTNDGTRILFRSHRDSWTLPVSKLYTVAVAGGPAVPLPMPSPVPATTRQMAHESFTRRAPATSAQKSDTAEGRRTTSSSWI
jgi:tricorn protease